MAQGLSTSVQSLIRLVGLAFARADLPADAMYSPIIHRDLPWQCPPLVTYAQLEKLPLQTIFNFEMACADESALLDWWDATLHNIYMSPSTSLTNGCYTGVGKAFTSSRLGARAYRFSVPVNYPEPLDRMAGITFSLEMAHAVYLGSALPRDLISDANNYYVKFRDSGQIIGVKDGVPAAGPDWGASAAGFVDELLTMPRGAVMYECHYDSIAKARSLLHEHPGRFPEFAELDLVLQALRYMTWSTPAPNVLQALHLQKQDRPRYQESLRKLRDSLSMLNLDVSDRAKLTQLHGTLVPEVIAPTTFRNQLYAGPPFPYMGVPEKMQNIRNFLQSKIDDLERKVGNANS